MHVTFCNDLHRLLRLQDLVVPHRGKDGTPIPNELLYGRAGYLYCLLLLSKMRRKEGTPWVTGAVITNVRSRIIVVYGEVTLIALLTITQLVNYIIEEGLRHQHEKDRPLHFEWHEKIYLGAAHGYVGILYMLLKVSFYLTFLNSLCYRPNFLTFDHEPSVSTSL